MLLKTFVCQTRKPCQKAKAVYNGFEIKLSIFPHDTKWLTSAACLRQTQARKPSQQRPAPGEMERKEVFSCPKGKTHEKKDENSPAMRTRKWLTQQLRCSACWRHHKSSESLCCRKRPPPNHWMTLKNYYETFKKRQMLSLSELSRRTYVFHWNKTEIPLEWSSWVATSGRSSTGYGSGAGRPCPTCRRAPRDCTQPAHELNRNKRF